MKETHTVGVVGVGTMGSAFTRWLLEAGFDVFVFDVDPDRLEEAEAAGATGCAHAAQLTDRSDVLLLSLPGSEYVEQAMEGEDGILETLGDGRLVIDTGTSRVETDVYYERRCRERGAEFVDAPMTRSGPGDRPVAFVGATTEAYEQARPVLEAISSHHHHFGPVGTGQVVKAGHRLRQNNMAMVDAEMVEFFRNNGVDAEAVNDLLELGVDGRFFEEGYPSTVGWTDALEAESETTTEPAVETGERPRADDDSTDDGADERTGYTLQEGIGRPRMDVSHWAKDQAYAIEIGHSSQTALPISSAVYQAMLASQNYAEALFDRELVFQDEDWFDRADPISHFRRLNRPAEEWRRVQENAEE